MKKSLFIMLLLVVGGGAFAQVKYLKNVAGTDPGDVIVSHNGKFLISSVLHELQVYEINQATGALTKKQSLKNIADFDYSYMYLSEDDRFLYAETSVREGTEPIAKILIHSFNAQTGAIKLEKNMDLRDHVKILPIDNVIMHVSPRGSLFFISNNSYQDLSIYRRNPSDGSLTYLNKISSNLVSMYFRFDFSPDEKNMYLYSPNIYKAAYVYSIDASSGSLSKIQEVICPNHRDYNSDKLIISPDGRFAYAIGTDSYASDQNQSDITQYSRDPQTGILSYQKNYPSLKGLGVTELDQLFIDGSGAFFYALNSFGDKLNGMHVFKRDVNTGDLTFQQSFLDRSPTDKMSGTFQMAFSKNNRFLYVTAARDNVVNIFENPNARESISTPAVNVVSTNQNNGEPEVETEVESNGSATETEVSEPVGNGSGTSSSGTNSGTGNSKDAFTDVWKRVQAESSETKKLDLCYELLEGKALKTVQIASIAMLFNSEFKRLEFVKFASYFVSDRENFKLLADLFTYENIKSDFNKLLK